MGKRGARLKAPPATTACGANLQSLMRAPVEPGFGYGWCITVDLLNMGPGNLGNAAGTCGPRGCKFTEEEIQLAGARFRMLDDDGEVYYEGRAVWSPDYNGIAEGFEPLDDFGRPNDGCTSIEYDVNGEWQVL